MTTTTATGEEDVEAEKKERNGGKYIKCNVSEWFVVHRSSFAAHLCISWQIAKALIFEMETKSRQAREERRRKKRTTNEISFQFKVCKLWALRVRVRKRRNLVRNCAEKERRRTSMRFHTECAMRCLYITHGKRQRERERGGYIFPDACGM